MYYWKNLYNCLLLRILRIVENIFRITCQTQNNLDSTFPRSFWTTLNKIRTHQSKLKKIPVVQIEIFRNNFLQLFSKPNNQKYSRRVPQIKIECGIEKIHQCTNKVINNVYNIPIYSILLYSIVFYLHNS